MTSHVSSYRADIDGLRAVAVLGVVLFHAFPSLLPGGFVGVDVFFVISGFLITGIIAERLAGGSFSFADFYVRRVRRIFPALVVVLAACLAAGWFMLLPGEFQALGRHALAAAGFMANFAFWADTGYFDAAAETKPLLHLWSLGIEEQFYLLWPLLLWVAFRRGWSLWVAALALTAVSFAANLLSIGRFPELTFYFPHTRLWELGAGAFLALRPARIRLSLSADSTAWLGLALLAAGFTFIRPADAFPGAWALLPVVGTMLLIEAGPQAGLNRWLLAQRVMVFIGLISYPLYLWHWPLLSFLHVQAAGGEPSVAARIAMVGLATLLSVLTWRFVEQPLRFGSSRRFSVRLLLSGMASVAVVAGMLWGSGGMPSRFKGGLLMDEETINAERLAYWAEGEWRRNFDAGSPKIFTFGDSQGFDVFKSLGLDTGLALRHFETKHECTAFDQPVKGKEAAASACEETFQRIFDSGDLEKVDVFIYTYSWWKDAEPENVLEHYRKGLERLRAVNPGMRIVFMGPKPLLGRHWVSINTLVKDQKSVASLNEYLNSIAWIRRDDIDYIRSLADQLGVEFVDAAAVYCFEGCVFYQDGQFAYFDQNHWTGLGARLFHDKLRRSGVWNRLFGQAQVVSRAGG